MQRQLLLDGTTRTVIHGKHCYKTFNPRSHAYKHANKLHAHLASDQRAEGRSGLVEGETVLPEQCASPSVRRAMRTGGAIQCMAMHATDRAADDVNEDFGDRVDYQCCTTQTVGREVGNPSHALPAGARPCVHMHLRACPCARPCRQAMRPLRADAFVRVPLCR